MLKILQARLQQYVNHELPNIQAGFRKGRGTSKEDNKLSATHRLVSDGVKDLSAG